MVFVVLVTIQGIQDFFRIVASKVGPKRGREKRDRFTRPGPKRGPENQENKRKIGKYKKSFMLGPKFTDF